MLVQTMEGYKEYQNRLTNTDIKVPCRRTLEDLAA